VYLIAPARWKAGVELTRRHARTLAVPLPAPAQWARSRAASGRLPASARRPAAERWLLPPTWPLDGVRATTVADLRRIVGTRCLPWLRTRMLSWRGRLVTYRRGLVASVALCAIAGVVLVSLRIGTPPAAEPMPAKATVAMPARQAPAMHASSLPTRPVPAAVATVPTGMPTIPAIVDSRPTHADRGVWSDASTMDLMMPIAEPDLDIRSQHSLWSQIGKASGVDPLLLYSIALVESKALYPDGRIAPTPWLFRVNDRLVRGDRHDVQLAMAAASQFGGAAVQDVGIMQVYYPMHRDAVRDPLTLLNPHTNISVAAKILRDGMRQTPDRVLGVGYYHSHTPSLARNYGTAVLTVYQRLKAIHRPAHRGRAVAR
jgi:hypothetical protein